MKLVNARGMSENLYKLKDYYRELYLKPSELITSLMVSKAIYELKTNSTEAHPDFLSKYSVLEHENDSISVFDVNQKEKALFTLNKSTNKDILELPFKIEGIAFPVYETKDIEDVSLNTFLEDYLPKRQKELEESFEQSFISMLNNDKEMQNYNDIFREQFPKLFKYAENHVGVKKRFIYNDLDNKFYKSEKNKVILGNQNYEVTITFKDNVYYVRAFVEDKDPKESLNGAFSFSMTKEDQKAFHIEVLDQLFLITHFMLDLEGAVKAYEFDNEIKEDLNPVVKTYDYHLAYFKKNFDLTKEDAIWRLLFYCFPIHNGTDKNGNYVYDERENLPYMKSCEKQMSTIHETMEHSEFKVPVIYKNNPIFKRIKNLNDDWKCLFQEGHDLVADFLKRYKDAPASVRKEMSYSNPDEVIPPLEEFLKISKKLISLNPEKTKKQTKSSNKLKGQ
jgi:hypothetical protein